ncbi:MAG: glycerophosphodiester phosphodiesterase family protein [Candidatus Cyclobacteriaceae bacterium M2_1C_046]
MRLLSLFTITAALLLTYTGSVNAQKIDIQGHRGARGLVPENSIPGFLKALDYGVTTLELDVVITGDSLVLVSHEPYISAEICLNKEGNELKVSEGKNINIYKMNYEEVEDYDCGSKPDPKFPEQENIPTHKPLLEDVIKAAEMHIKSETGYLVDYNIEIKSTPKGDGIYHPDPEKFSELVHDLVDQYLPWERVIIQSFDFRVLQHWNEKYPEVRLAALIATPGSFSTKLNKIGFQPDIFSPNYRLLNQEKVNYLHNLGIKVIPWTVNDPKKMIELVKMGVDGLITDYPNRAAALGYTLEIENTSK